jgi:hypothetical protein
MGRSIGAGGDIGSMMRRSGLWLRFAGGVGRFLLGYFVAVLGLWINLPLPL